MDCFSWILTDLLACCSIVTSSYKSQSVLLNLKIRSLPFPVQNPPRGAATVEGLTLFVFQTHSPYFSLPVLPWYGFWQCGGPCLLQLFLLSPPLQALLAFLQFLKDIKLIPPSKLLLWAASVSLQGWLPYFAQVTTHRFPPWKPVKLPLSKVTVCHHAWPYFSLLGLTAAWCYMIHL